VFTRRGPGMPSGIGIQIAKRAEPPNTRTMSQSTHIAARWLALTLITGNLSFPYCVLHHHRR
jgi:hypothetical protein